MYVPSFIKTERGSDGAHDFRYNKVPLFARKPWNINTSMYDAHNEEASDRKRYKPKAIPPDFLSSNISRLALQDIISKTESLRKTKVKLIIFTLLYVTLS